MTSLYQGWNLVGFPSDDTTYTAAQLKADTGATIVEGWSATGYHTVALADATNLAWGNAYWIYIPSASPSGWSKTW